MVTTTCGLAGVSGEGELTRGGQCRGMGEDGRKEAYASA